jgi:hypothetical protein
MKGFLRLVVSFAFAAFLSAAPAFAQTPDYFGDQATLQPIVKGAPYPEEGITSVDARLFDGTHIERSVTAKFYRDSAGRIRRKQTVIGLGLLDPGTDALFVITIVDPVAGFVYSLHRRPKPHFA